MSFLKKIMQSKILSKIILSLVILSGLALLTSSIFYFTTQSLSQTNSAPLATNVATLQKTNSAPPSANVTALQKVVNLDLATGQVGLPTRLKIPSIKVDAPVEYVGLTSDGAMDVPKDTLTVGWFDLGPRPGENGSAVLAGHYGTINNIPQVFNNLHKLHKDDKIYIEDEKGKNIIFVVREVQRYSKEDNSSGIFSSSDGKAHLNLITCAGVWNEAEKTFSERLVVFTDKE
jgi:LPXTG-site transpeptidase (sortase) family protein